MRSMACAVGLLALLGCGSERPVGQPLSARPPTPEGLAGCYALFDRGGRPASDSLYFAPSHVRLLTTEREPTPFSDSTVREWALTKLDGRRRPVREDGRAGWLYWGMRSAGDTVVMSFHTRYSGSRLFFEVPPGPVDTLRGRAEEYFDIGASVSDAGAVTAVRVSCRPRLMLRLRSDA